MIAISLELDDVFEILGVDPGSVEVQVLQAILEIREKDGRTATINDIKEKLGKKRGKTPSKAWVYKILKTLNEAGLIVIETMPPPSRYMTSRYTITGALEKKLDTKQNEMTQSVEGLQGKIKFLKSFNPHQLALHLVKILSKTKYSKEQRIVEGLDNVRLTIIREICEPAKKGDTIRITQDISTVPMLQESPLSVERELMTAALRGVKVRALMSGASMKDLAPMVSYFDGIQEYFVKVIATGNIELRLRSSSNPTYRMVSLNDDLMILILTSYAHPDQVALVTRSYSPDLIDDAISKFDGEWNEGIDYIAMMAQLQQKASE